MQNKHKIALVTLATPALCAAEPALAHAATAPVVSVQSNSQAISFLKAGMLAIDPAEKLNLAGDVLLSRAVDSKALRFAKAGAANDRTNTDIPECRAAMSRGGSSSTGKANDRTNTDIPECHSPSATQRSGSVTPGKHNDRTNTDIPECHSPKN